jgi:hypothetical protein
MELIRFGISGDIQIDIENAITGEKRSYQYHNKATNAFLNRIAQWISGIATTGTTLAQCPTKLQFGTGSGVPASSDSALFAPVSASTINISARQTSANQVTLLINYPANYVTGTFTEAGLMDDNLVLLTHVILSPTIQITQNESVTITYTLTINTQ